MSNVDVRTVPGVDVASGEMMSVTNETALHLACDVGMLPMCKALLSRGADRTARNSEQQTPLHFAAKYGHLPCVVWLVGRTGKVRMTPAEVDAADDKGWTGLHCAAYGFDQISAVLIGAGAKLDAQDADGWTPVVLAHRYQSNNVALLALLSGAAPAQQPGLVCDHCGLNDAPPKKLRPCGQCYAVSYCGKKCQLAAWPRHKVACKAWAEELEDGTRPTAANADIRGS